ncbi:MAG TPA: mandelate racemase/muconate lactonizing enzyme family protein [Acidimicrobiales bacterium]|nr:mandelate racemase/muconate lactonizing enzyme family protein [Acidimicrobiales bacterium]
MRIASVEVLQVGSEISGAHTLVRLASDSGVTGLGQSGAWGYPLAVAAVVSELRPLLLGADPFRTEHLWNAMTRVRPFRGNLVAAAISAVDNALWDLKGKALEVPAYELLGGRCRDKVRLHALIGGVGPDELAAAVKSTVSEGYTAVKFDPLIAGYEDLTMGRLVDSACEMAAAARDAGGGVDVIYELHRKLDPAKGVVVANALAAFRPLFIEDPIQIDSITANAEVCRRIEAPTAIGERLSSVYEYRDLLSHGVAIHVRPDVGLSGGLTGSRKIAALAEAFYCGVIPHNFLGPGLTAPTLQLCVAIPNLVTLEYAPRDEDRSSSSAAFTTAVVRRGGYLEIPEAPGIGVELSPDHETAAPVLERTAGWRGLLHEDGSVIGGVL